MSLTDDSLFGKIDGQLVNSGPTAVNPYGSKWDNHSIEVANHWLWALPQSEPRSDQTTNHQPV